MNKDKRLIKLKNGEIEVTKQELSEIKNNLKNGKRNDISKLSGFPEYQMKNNLENIK